MWPGCEGNFDGNFFDEKEGKNHGVYKTPLCGRGVKEILVEM